MRAISRTIEIKAEQRIQLYSGRATNRIGLSATVIFAAFSQSKIEIITRPFEDLYCAGNQSYSGDRL
jgi:hypothetical protein